MRQLLIISFLLLCMTGITQLTAGSDGQSRTVDSLTNRLQENLHDTDRINILHTIARQFLYSNPDTAILLASEALSIAKESQWESGIANSAGKLGVHYHLKGDYAVALEYYFAALKMSEDLRNKKYIANNLGNIGLVFHHQGNFSKALEHYFKALKMNEEMERKPGIVTSLGNIGNVYSVQNDHPKALEYYFKALKMDE